MTPDAVLAEGSPPGSRILQVPLTWHPSPFARRLSGALGVAVGLAVLLGRPAMVVLAAPLAVALALGSRSESPREVQLEVGWTFARAFEQESQPWTVTARADCPLEQLTVELASPAWCRLTPRAFTGTDWIAQTVEVQPHRWGRHRLGPAQLTAVTPGRLHRGYGVVADLARIDVFPREEAARRAPNTPVAVGHVGERTSRRPGPGVEFAGIHPFGPGDRPRRVNWPVTLRRGTLYVTETAIEQAADIVLLIDAVTVIGPPGDTTLDRSLRAATGLARAWLRSYDRVGLIVTGAPLQWLTGQAGQRQFYRIVAAMLDAGVFDSAVSPDISRIPRPVLPPAALIVALSPLLDDRSVAVIRDLRHRGHRVLVVDVLDIVPDATGRYGKLVERVWRLYRETLHHELAAAGVPVLVWRPGEPLDAALDPIIRRMPVLRAAPAPR